MKLFYMATTINDHDSREVKSRPITYIEGYLLALLIHQVNVDVWILESPIILEKLVSLLTDPLDELFGG